MPNSSEKKTLHDEIPSMPGCPEPEAPTWANTETEWANGTPVGPAEYQEMFRHLWNWHRAVEDSNTNGTSNGESLSDLISSLNSTSESTGLQAAYAVPQLGEQAGTCFGPVSARRIGDNASKRLLRAQCSWNARCRCAARCVERSV